MGVFQPQRADFPGNRERFPVHRGSGQPRRERRFPAAATGIIRDPAFHMPAARGRARTAPREASTPRDGSSVRACRKPSRPFPRPARSAGREPCGVRSYVRRQGGLRRIGDARVRDARGRRRSLPGPPGRVGKTAAAGESPGRQRETPRNRRPKADARPGRFAPPPGPSPQNFSVHGLSSISQVQAVLFWRCTWR